MKANCSKRSSCVPRACMVERKFVETRRGHLGFFLGNGHFVGLFHHPSPSSSLTELLQNSYFISQEDAKDNPARHHCKIHQNSPPSKHMQNAVFFKNVFKLKCQSWSEWHVLPPLCTMRPCQKPHRAQNDPVFPWS